MGGEDIYTVVLRSEMKSALKLLGIPSEYFVEFFIALWNYYEDPSRTPKHDNVHVNINMYFFTDENENIPNREINAKYAKLTQSTQNIRKVRK